MKRTCPTKRNAVSLATRFYDPLGIISLITVRFKQLFQKLYERKLYWDENLIGELLTEWEGLVSVSCIPRCSVQTSECDLMKVPRLELLSALLLARLISIVQHALEPEIQLTSVTCHTDSQVALSGLLDTRSGSSSCKTEWQRYASTHHPTAGSTAQEFIIQQTSPPGVYPRRRSWDCGSIDAPHGVCCSLQQNQEKQ